MVTPGRRVLKWDVPVNDDSNAIGPGPIVAVSCQYDDRSVQVWTIEDGPTVPYPLTRRVQVFGTGQPLPDNARRHVGTAWSPHGLVWHLFEMETR